jgi:hemerythrin
MVRGRGWVKVRVSHFIEWSDVLSDGIDAQHKVETCKTAIGFGLIHFPKICLTKHIMEGDQLYGQHFVDARLKAKSKK